MADGNWLALRRPEGSEPATRDSLSELEPRQAKGAIERLIGNTIVVESPYKQDIEWFWNSLRTRLYQEGGALVETIQQHLDVQLDFARELRETFDTLVTEWRRDTASQLPARRAMNFAYQQIIGMGRDALPLILEELAREMDDWFWALAAITRTDAAEGTESLSDATKAWLQWGTEHGYLRALPA
jgi:hypothetical protein